MPEGHTIHALARDHRRWLAGQSLSITSPQGRLTEAAARLDQRRLKAVSASGKHLFYEFDGSDVVHVHLGLFGRYLRHPSPPPSPRETVRLRLSGRKWTVDLVGATICELITPADVSAILNRLGPDPLRTDADPGRAWVKLRRRAGPVGAALLDQSLISGVGNVYRAESLFVHGIHPARPAREVTREEWIGLWSTLVTMLGQGLREGRIITVDAAELGKPRKKVARGEGLYVYKQLACRRCGGAIRRWDLAGRWAYACERCQPG